MKYQKTLFLSLTFFFVLLAQAQNNTPSSVKTIPEKDSQFENTVTTAEFNAIVNTLRGLYNFFSDGQAQLGINEEQPASSLTLDVGGRIGADEYCDSNGENCINPATWDARPQLELQPPAANCQIRYKAKDQKYESEWQETGSNNDPIGAISRFNSGLKHNCGGEGCGVIMSLKCKPNFAVTQEAICRLRYRLSHPNAGGLAPWVTTGTTDTPDTWIDGEWSLVNAPQTAWGQGLNLQVGLDCQGSQLRCQVGHKLHNELESTPWMLSNMTDGEGWKDADVSQLTASTQRACDQRIGCGLQLQSRCVGTASTLKTALFSCPTEKDGRCPSQCNGQISLNDKCSYQKLSAEDECNVLLTEKCEAIGHLVQ